MTPRKANKINIAKLRLIPINQAASRMGAEFACWIVIPVVVGSSPISHPSIYKETLLLIW